ncbi:chloride channel protein [Aetokthonos hydrillicola Thurmond2011]|jgi:CIC family chloride channel protein|uniref:Chloride channel protein n=1 Tax=Aetokthonos hydrillicola Thurmond2011 TaxID=2712845 RepID=A0AAP5I2I4_9CYAN|nr:chloride channel protein [Aetokthonos hydrillicola]MBO3458295.1 CBS domain-containing protein [Aetokthonos hydrillicola CCALA 1050]MBW4585857.1 chloride channel protein [Aetokthonos hydrillicola CCALA 1050]MDR9893917.1 chloride channel protein [Aetokthonos hydrillicola Thurmond2011]
MIHIRQILWSRLSRLLLQPKRLAIFEACLIGLVSGLAAVFLGQSVGWLGGWRQHISHVLPAYVVLPTIGLVGGFLSGWLVEHIAPSAAGSGMSEVKAVLARVPMPLNLRIALVKLVSATLVLASGMPLGREGPTVQIGASLANQLSHWFRTSPDHRRQLIAAGAGAGLAAAFDAPIAGVLFVVEELLQDVSGITLGTAILASFIAAVVARICGTHSLDLNLHFVIPNTSFFAEEIPFYVLMGILAGFGGVLFNRGILAGLRLNRRFLRISLPWRVGLAGLVTGLALVILPPVFRDNAGLRELLLAGGANWQLVAIAFCIQFLLILITHSSGAPGGLLVPTLGLGAALGYLIGAWEYHWLGLSLATTYARVGMGAFFSGVARVPITAVIIVFEMTNDFNLVLPLMIVSVIAYLVAEAFEAGSLYDKLLEFKGIHLSHETTRSGPWMELTASDVMQSRVETLANNMSLDEALHAFSESSHRAFPVLKDGKLVGILTQKDIATLSQRGLSGKHTVEDAMTPEPVTARPKDTLAYVLHLLNRYSLRTLPVVEGRRLVGIITRSDIIRVEAAYLNGQDNLTGPKAEPSRVIYSTRSPETGQGRLLVLLRNPKTAATLLEIAVAIARDRHYEIECLHVIVVPRHQSLAQTHVSTSSAQNLLRQAIRLGQAWDVPVHTQIRVAHDLSEAILQTIKDRYINLVLTGWKGSTTTRGRVFSRVLDTLIRQAACEVVLVKLKENSNFERWLVPIAGGPNAQQAIRLLPALTSLSKTPEVNLCQVFNSNQVQPDTTTLEKAANFLKKRLHGLVKITPVHAISVSEAILECARQNHSDVIILGASREGMLHQVIHDNIPATISRNNQQTVILVRQPQASTK